MITVSYVCALYSIVQMTFFKMYQTFWGGVEEAIGFLSKVKANRRSIVPRLLIFIHSNRYILLFYPTTLMLVGSNVTLMLLDHQLLRNTEVLLFSKRRSVSVQLIVTQDFFKSLI